jgi:hypothetical protein
VTQIELRGDAIAVGDRFSIAFQRTLRVPADGTEYPLPPGLGRLPVGRLEEARFFVPLHRGEALWLAFDGRAWKPNVVQVGVGGINAISGGAWEARLEDSPQNYLVTPDQPWLDGINTGTAVVRQFVAVELGAGATVEEQLRKTQEVGGIQVRVFEPKPGRFPDEPPAEAEELVPGRPLRAPQLGLGAGGSVRQKIYPDRHGIAAWDPSSETELHVELLTTAAYRALTGREPPPTPVSAETYTQYGLPWFELYDEVAEDVPASERLAGVEPVEGAGERLDVDPAQVRGIDTGGKR